MSLSDFGENLAILTTPSYMADTNPFMPSALFSHINNFEVSDNNQPDGLIWINSDLNWNCAFSSTSSSSQSLNLYSHILRSVAICLGSVLVLQNMNPVKACASKKSVTHLYSTI